MKRHTNRLVRLLGILLVIGMATGSETGVAQGQVTVTLGTLALNAGASGVVDGRIDCPIEGGCAAFAIAIRFDPAVIRVDRAEVGPYLGEFITLAENAVDNENGAVRLAAAAIGATPEYGEPALLRLYVTALAPGVTALTVTELQIADQVGNEVVAESISGAVAVMEGAAATPEPTLTPTLLPTAAATSTPAATLASSTAQEAWASSGHADADAEAFRHWDEENPKEIPVQCARCHSGPGYLDYLGADGSAAGVVDVPAPVDTVITCDVCHNSVAFSLDWVTFPSGSQVGFGEDVVSNLCINCHQGRESTLSINRVIVTAGVGDDVVTEMLRFRNIHYFAAGATLFGGDAMGGYQYDGKEYVGRFAHAPGFDTCVACHDAHALTVQVDKCAQCHGDFSVPQNIRMMAGDWDGDGTTEGVSGEIDTMREGLLAAIQTYAVDVIGTPIVYDSLSYPYFFIDTNGNGRSDENEADSSNTYPYWTPTLLRAAYNYQYSVKDPGAFAHNGRYVAELLYDSAEAIGGPEAVAGWTRP
jgi:hypothetical protein